MMRISGLIFAVILAMTACSPAEDGNNSGSSSIIDSGSGDLNIDLSLPDGGRPSDAGRRTDEGGRPDGGDDTGRRRDRSHRDVTCELECDDGCDLDEDTCECVCPPFSCGDLDYCDCINVNGCQPVENGCVCPCDMECPEYENCACDCGGGTFEGCAPVGCPSIGFCGDDCTVIFLEDGCAECICGEPDTCSDIDNYCDCIDADECRAFVQGPTCGLDCECEGLACGCPSGIFIDCMPEWCHPIDAPCREDDGCGWATNDSGCPICECEEPECGGITDYCDCAETAGCEVVAFSDCGYACECDPAVDCACGGTELLACQPTQCGPLDETCDTSDGRCSIEHDADGCAECNCVGDDSVCEGLDYCGCFLNPLCDVQESSCICPCDYECPGFEDCVCVCGGGDYLGCETRDP